MLKNQNYIVSEVKNISHLGRWEFIFTKSKNRQKVLLMYSVTEFKKKVLVLSVIVLSA